MDDSERYRRWGDKVKAFAGFLVFGGLLAAWVSGVLTGSPTRSSLLLFAVLMVPVVLIALLLTRPWDRWLGDRPQRSRAAATALMAGQGSALERLDPEHKALIDELVLRGDCAALRAEGEIAGCEDAPEEVVAYIDAAWEAAGCQPLDWTEEDLVRLMALYYPDRKAEIDDLAALGDVAGLDAAWKASRAAFEPQFIWDYIAVHINAVDDAKDLEPNQLSILSGKHRADDH